MTRMYTSRRTRPLIVRRAPRDPSITRIGFTMFRLESYQNHASDEPAFVPVELISTRNAMSALALI